MSNQPDRPQAKSGPAKIPVPVPALEPEGQPLDLRTLRSEDLLQGAREIQIEHRGQIYRLLQTRNGKLLLQK